MYIKICIKPHHNNVLLDDLVITNRKVKIQIIDDEQIVSYLHKQCIHIM